MKRAMRASSVTVEYLLSEKGESWSAVIASSGPAEGGPAGDETVLGLGQDLASVGIGVGFCLVRESPLASGPGVPE